MPKKNNSDEIALRIQNLSMMLFEMIVYNASLSEAQRRLSQQIAESSTALKEIVALLPESIRGKLDITHPLEEFGSGEVDGDLSDWIKRKLDGGS